LLSLSAESVFVKLSRLAHFQFELNHVQLLKAFVVNEFHFRYCRVSKSRGAKSIWTYQCGEGDMEAFCAEYNSATYTVIKMH